MALTTCPVTRGFDKRGMLLPVYCGSWQCPHCARVLARQWAWRCRLQMDDDPRVYYFWTCTLRGKYHTALSGFQALPRLWDNLRKAVSRSVGTWSYCAFVEGQPKRDFMPHFHIISSVKAPYRIKDFAWDRGFGYQATETRVDGPKAASYCAKYASKVSPHTPKGFRRVRASRDWAKMPDQEFFPLIVKSRRETVTEFILRAHELTGVPMDDLYERWDAVMMEDG